MGCSQSVPLAADPAAPTPAINTDPVIELQVDQGKGEVSTPVEEESPKSNRSHERVRSMKLDRPVSVRKNSTAVLPAIETMVLPAKPLGAREQVQQLYAALRLKEAGYLSVGESKVDGGAVKHQPTTQALAACTTTLQRMEDHEMLSELVEFNLPQAVIATMRNFQHAPSVQAACFELVDRMVEGSVHNKDRLRLAGVCPALVSSLLQVIDDKDMVLGGLESMLRLMTENTQNVIAMGNAGAHSLIVTVMATHADDVEIQALGCICMQHLARNGASSHALGKTVAALCMQPSNIVEFGQAGLCEVLVRLMDERPDAIALQGLLLPMIQQLGRHESNRQKLHAANVCESLMTVHLQHPAIVFIQEHFCETVFVLAQDDTISTDLGNMAACESILQMMRRLSHYPQMHYLCCLALYALSHTPANYQRLGQTGALQQIQRALDQFDESAAAAITGAPTSSKKSKGTRKLGPNAKVAEDGGRAPSVKYILTKMGHLRLHRANSTSSSVDFGSDTATSHEVVPPQHRDEEEHHGSDSEDEDEQEEDEAQNAPSVATEIVA